jgi:5,10-methylenetetrahydromethanopterin reductase
MLPEFSASVEAYVAHARSFMPADAYYLANHRGHLMFVRPDERPFLSADLIRHTTWTATAPELIGRVEALEAAGFSQVVFSILPGQEHAVEDWGKIRRAFA